MAYKFHIAIDKLEITYTAPDSWREHFSDIPDLYTEKCDLLILERKPSRHYKYEFNVFCEEDEGEKQLIGMLYWTSYNKNRPDVYFSYENEALYKDNEYSLHCRFYIEEVLGLEFKQISKIEIALDTNISVVRRFYKVLRDESFDVILNGKKLHSDMKRNISGIAGNYNGSRANPYKNKSFYIHNNSDSNDLQVVGYNKSLEIENESEKTYIEKEIGFGGIYRLEVRCNNHKQIRKVLDNLGWYEEDLYSKLQIEEYRFLLFENICNRLIRFSKRRKIHSLTDIIFNDHK